MDELSMIYGVNNSMQVFNESGKGYWMKGFGCLRAEGENRPSRPTHIIVLNDQGGSVMDVSSIACCLRAQDHGHPPVICFEPGIMSRDCSVGNRAYENVCSTLRAQMGDNQPAVCYPINLMVATRGGKDDMRTCFGIGEQNDPQFTLSSAHEHAVCYGISRSMLKGGMNAGGMPVKEEIQPSITANGCGAVCYDARGNGEGGWYQRLQVTTTGI